MATTFKIKHPGALTRRAAREGRSIQGEAEHDLNAPGLKGKQARFYENVLRGHHGKHSTEKLKRPGKARVHPVKMKKESSLLAHILGAKI